MFRLKLYHVSKRGTWWRSPPFYLHACLFICLHLSVQICLLWNNKQGIFYWLRIFTWYELYEYACLRMNALLTNRERIIEDTHPLFTSFFMTTSMLYLPFPSPVNAHWAHRYSRISSTSQDLDSKSINCLNFWRMRAVNEIDFQRFLCFLLYCFIPCDIYVWQKTKRIIEESFSQI